MERLSISSPGVSSEPSTCPGVMGEGVGRGVAFWGVSVEEVSYALVAVSCLVPLGLDRSCSRWRALLSLKSSLQNFESLHTNERT